jgi:hypothetical protein
LEESSKSILDEKLPLISQRKGESIKAMALGFDTNKIQPIDDSLYESVNKTVMSAAQDF